MSVEIFIDPSMLAIPNMGSDIKSVEELLGRVQQLGTLIEKKIPVRICSTYNLLDEIGPSYPTLELISEFLEMHGVEDFSARDLQKAMNAIFQRVLSASDDSYGEVLSGDLEDDCFESPGDNDIEFPPSLSRTLLTCMMRRFNGACTFLLTPIDYTIVLRDGQRHALARVALVGELRNVVSTVNSNDLRTIENIIELESLEVAHDAWSRASADADFASSIWFGGRAIMRINSMPLVSPIFAIGSEFTKSLTVNQASNANTFSQLTAKTCFLAVGAPERCGFRLFHKVSSRDHDGAVALRAQINTGNPAKRLMVWRRKDSTLELANVGPKRELLIEFGKRPALQCG